jgi:hypothetical protein
MTSVLNVDTIADKAGTGPVALTKQSAAKMYANFEMDSTQAITKSFNSASITDNGTGDTTISMTNSMGDANYIQIGNNVHDSGSYVVHNSFDHDGPSTSSNVIMNCCLNNTGALHDGEHQMVVVHGDLA